MALIETSALINDIRGSVGGNTFARNRGGLYARARRVPLNPRSVRQTAVRSVFGDLSQVWANTLTEAQRTAWRTYADNVPLPNSLGDPRSVTGLNMYQRGNTLLLDTAGARVDDGPTIFTVGPTITPTITLDTVADTLTVTDLGGYDPAVSGTVGLLLTQGPPQSPGVNFFQSPFQKASGTQVADLMTDLPTAVPLPFPIAAGQAIFIRTSVVTTDGRVGVPVVQRFLAA